MSEPINPVIGLVLTKPWLRNPHRGRVYTVTSVSKRGFVMMARDDGVMIPLGRTYFIKWARNAEIVQRGENV